MPLLPPSAPAPPSYTAVELSRAVGIPLPTLKHWITEGLMKKPPFRARRTVYGREHLIWALAIKKLREHKVPLAAIKERLAAIPLDELGREVLPPEPAPVAPNVGLGPTIDAGIGQTWQRVELLPGLELHVRVDAGPLARRVAEEIRKTYGASA